MAPLILSSEKVSGATGDDNYATHNREYEFSNKDYEGSSIINVIGLLCIGNIGFSSQVSTQKATLILIYITMIYHVKFIDIKCDKQ